MSQKFKIKGFEPSKREADDIYELLDIFQEDLAKFILRSRLQGMIKSLPYWELPPYTGPNGELIYRVAQIYDRGIGYNVFAIVIYQEGKYQLKDYYLTKIESSFPLL